MTSMDPCYSALRKKAMKTISTVTPDIQVVILDMSEVSMLDVSEIVAMESIVNSLADKQIGLVINNLKPRMILKLSRAGIMEQTGKVAFSRKLPEAIATAKNMH